MHALRLKRERMGDASTALFRWAFKMARVMRMGGFQLFHDYGEKLSVRKAGINVSLILIFRAFYESIIRNCCRERLLSEKKFYSNLVSYNTNKIHVFLLQVSTHYIWRVPQPRPLVSRSP